MPDEIQFQDLAALLKITPETVVERYGAQINSSFFDASNILGTLKIKGLIDFTTAFPGQSAVHVTDNGKKLITEADERATQPFDHLDYEVLTQLSGGKRSVVDIGSAVNIRPKDLAMHIYKLEAQDYLVSTFKSGNVDLALTEKGFLQVKNGMPQDAGAIQQAALGEPIPPMGSTMITQQASPQQAQAQQSAPQPAAAPQAPYTPPPMQGGGVLGSKLMIVWIAVLIVLVIVVLLYAQVI
ncbi:MAG: hypothetical protein KGH98_00110 [Candidatus Micrarchaeota archaeon]|nr:hypothetical protein [Candidatus Micrarchaeota archaeon]